MTKPPSPRPLSVKVLSIGYFVGAVAGVGRVISVIQYGDIFIFGFLLPPNLLRLHDLPLILLGFYLGIGLWRLKEMARRIAIGYTCFGLLDRIVAVANLSYEHMVMKESLPQGLYSFVVTGMFFGSYAAEVAILGIILYFLIKRKSAFVKPSAPPQ